MEPTFGNKVVQSLLLCVMCAFLCEARFQGCKDAGYCCEGKNSTCLAMPGGAQSTERCYCDEYCEETGDCCTDYMFICKNKRVSVDCKVSEWRKWGECNAACGLGVQRRNRKVIITQKHGGKPCPKLFEKRRCLGDRCWEIQEIGQWQERREIGKILPASFGIFRSSKQYDPYQDIRKNLFLNVNNEVPVRPAYTAQYKIVESSRYCNTTDFGKTWANMLQAGNTVCIECQPFAMNKELGMRCKGHGVVGVETRWNAVDISHCHGKWIQLEIHHTGTCDLHDNKSFILI